MKKFVNLDFSEKSQFVEYHGINIVNEQFVSSEADEEIDSLSHKMGFLKTAMIMNINTPVDFSVKCKELLRSQ